MRLAGLSIDVDSVASHLEGYGHDRPDDDGVAYRVAVPRALAAFEAAGARATFFLIGEEAARHPETVREIAARGHEVASHSMTHRLPFSDLDSARERVEVVESKKLLEGISGADVRGFRAPSWDLSDGLLRALVDAGYRYDASTYPSLLLPLLRRSIARRSRTGRVRTGSGLFAGVFGPTQPHLRSIGERKLVEVPMCTAPFTRLPYYHTPRFVFPAPVFAAIRALTQLRRGPIAYQFHAVDFLGLGEDRLDPRISAHPGMHLPLERKLELARGELRALGSGRRIVPLADVAAGVAT